MESRENEPYPRMPEFSTVALGILTAIVYVAGFTVVACWFVLLLEQSRTSV